MVWLTPWGKSLVSFSVVFCNFNLMVNLNCAKWHDSRSQSLLSVQTSCYHDMKLHVANHKFVMLWLIRFLFFFFSFFKIFTLSSIHSRLSFLLSCLIKVGTWLFYLVLHHLLQAMYEGILVDIPFATFFLSKLKEKWVLLVLYFCSSSFLQNYQLKYFPRVCFSSWKFLLHWSILSS